MHKCIPYAQTSFLRLFEPGHSSEESERMNAFPTKLRDKFQFYRADEMDHCNLLYHDSDRDARTEKTRETDLFYFPKLFKNMKE